MNPRKPRLAMVSIGIRRDLLGPLQYFTNFELEHFYRQSVYGDLSDADLDSTLRAYTSPQDLYHQLVRAQPDVIQGVEPFSFYTQPYVWAGYFAARKTRARLLVATLENRPLAIKFGQARAFLLQNILRAYFARACLILALNRGAYDNAMACGARGERMQHALWGVWGADTQEFFPRPGRDANQPPTILFAGRLHPEKGIFVLLDAFELVRMKIPNAQLLMAGDGPARAAVSEIVRSKALSAAVTLLGVVKNREMVNVFHRADVFCAPSVTTRKWAEQVGAAALQAMACGIPIVSTHSGSISEYVPDSVAGILVQEQDANQLAEALIRLLTNPQFANELGARGRALACSHYDARSNVQRGETLVLEHCVKYYAHSF